jgi:hypothetical protein
LSSFLSGKKVILNSNDVPIFGVGAYLVSTLVVGLAPPSIFTSSSISFFDKSWLDDAIGVV